MHEAMYYKKHPGYIECTLCPVHCRIKPGQAGFCRVRKNIGGTLYASTYGKVSAIHVDPVEKKPLKLFMPGTYTLSIGSCGCNMRCPFCQNYGISQQPPDMKDLTLDALLSLAKKYNTPSVSYTYNEPTMFYEYMRDTAEAAKNQGLKNIIVTNGYISQEPLNALLCYIDAVNIDLKSFNEKTYRKLGGSLNAVLNTIKTAAGRVHVEITMLIVTGLTDDMGEIEQAAQHLAEIDRNIPVHLTRYFPRYRYAEEPTDLGLLQRAADVCAAYLTHVFIGNV